MKKMLFCVVALIAISEIGRANDCYDADGNFLCDGQNQGGYNIAGINDPSGDTGTYYQNSQTASGQSPMHPGEIRCDDWKIADVWNNPAAPKCGLCFNYSRACLKAGDIVNGVLVGFEAWVETKTECFIYPNLVDYYNGQCQE